VIYQRPADVAVSVSLFAFYLLVNSLKVVSDQIMPVEWREGDRYIFWLFCFICFCCCWQINCSLHCACSLFPPSISLKKIFKSACVCTHNCAHTKIGVRACVCLSVLSVLCVYHNSTEMAQDFFSSIFLSFYCCERIDVVEKPLLFLFFFLFVAKNVTVGAQGNRYVYSLSSPPPPPPSCPFQSCEQRTR